MDPVNVVIPPGLRHQYWVGRSISQEKLPFYLALIAAPLFALFPAGLGAGLAEASPRTRDRFESSLGAAFFTTGGWRVAVHRLLAARAVGTKTRQRSPAHIRPGDPDGER